MALHLLAHPGVLAAGAGALALLGFGGYKLMQKTKASTALSDAEKKRNALLSAAYQAGKKDGGIDAAADSGKVHNPRPTINYSDDPKIQQQFYNGYNDEYEKLWVAPAVIPDVVPGTPAKPGGSKGMSAYDYGASRGRSAGRQAADDGVAGEDVKGLVTSNLASAGSIERQKESGDPPEYRRGYTDGFGAGYGARQSEIALGGLFGVFGLGHFNNHATSGFKGAVAGFMVAGFPGAAVGAVALPVVVEARRHGLIPERYHAMVRGLPHAVTGAAGGFAVAGIPGAFVGAVALPVIALLRNRLKTAPKDRPAPTPNPPAPAQTHVGGRQSRRSMLSRRGVPA